MGQFSKACLAEILLRRDFSPKEDSLGANQLNRQLGAKHLEQYGARPRAVQLSQDDTLPLATHDPSATHGQQSAGS